MTGTSTAVESSIHPIALPNPCDPTWNAQVITEEVDYLDMMMSCMQDRGIKDERLEKEIRRLAAVREFAEKGQQDGTYITQLRYGIRKMASPLVKLFVDSEYRNYKKRAHISFRYKVFHGNFTILAWHPWAADFTRTGDPDRLDAIATFLEDPDVDVRRAEFWVYGVGDEGMPRLARMLDAEGFNLNEIAVENDRLTSEGAQTATEFIPHLRRMRLGYQNLGDEGAKALFAATKDPNSRLEELDLISARLTDDCIGGVIDTLQCQSNRLRLLNLAGNKFTPSGVEALQDSARSSRVSVDLRQQAGWGRDYSYLV